MIPITRLLTGKATVSAAVRAQSGPGDALRFSAENRPVVVWNSTVRCNLECLHCYAKAGDGSEGELSSDEARSFIADLAATGVPVLLFSGGEPLMRGDLFELAAFARSRGLRTVLSTNGTLITPEIARRVKEAGFSYVGVSIDGAQETHDRFRNRRGAFAEALCGLKNAAAAGLRTGVRFTLTRDNRADLATVLDLVERERINRFCLYHLVYSGRGADIADRDVSRDQSRGAVEMLIEKALDWDARGIETEILTADNHADGMLVLGHVAQHDPGRTGEVREMLRAAGGCSAGRKIAAVDAAGEVHPCQFWRQESLGNVRERPLSEIWRDSSLPLLAALRANGLTVGDASRCARCTERMLCGGCRVRALGAGGDARGEDPQCYLDDTEIGLGKTAEGPRP